MGRESHGQDPTVVHSSIALLQERFRRLQRVKEMREERELLRMLTSETKQHSSNSKPTMRTTMTTTYELPPTMSFSHPELMVIPSTRTPPPLPHHSHVSLSLWPSSSSSSQEPPQEKLSMATFLEPEAPPVSMNLWKNAYDCDGPDSDSGVDTSLHL